MVEGMVRHRYGDDFEVRTAGAGATSVPPMAIKVMYDVGIDISQQRSKTVVEFLGRNFDHVMTLCGDNAKEVCPAFSGEATT
jgi:arsenate reductase